MDGGKTMKYQLDEDRILKDLLADLPKEKAPADFTYKVMEHIDKEEASAFLTEKGLPKARYILTVLVVLAVSVFMIYTMDMSWLKMLGMNLDVDAASTVEGYRTVTNGFGSLVTAVGGLSSKLGIATAIVLLFGLERYLKYRSTHRQRTAYMA